MHIATSVGSFVEYIMMHGTINIKCIKSYLSRLYFMHIVGSIFFCWACQPCCVVTLKEFLVARVKVMVQVPKDTVLKFAVLVCNWIWFRISSHRPDISRFSSVTIGIVQPPETDRM